MKTSLTDIPFAIEDAELLREIGYNMVKTEETEGKGLVSEGEYRFLIGKYEGKKYAGKSLPVIAKNWNSGKTKFHTQRQ